MTGTVSKQVTVCPGHIWTTLYNQDQTEVLTIMSNSPSLRCRHSDPLKYTYTITQHTPEDLQTDTFSSYPNFSFFISEVTACLSWRKSSLPPVYFCSWLHDTPDPKEESLSVKLLKPYCIYFGTHQSRYPHPYRESNCKHITIKFGFTLFKWCLYQL